MTKTEAILKKMKVLPRSMILVGGRPEEEFISAYFPKSLPTDILCVDELVSEAVAKIRDHSILAPKGDHRVVCVKNVCSARRYNQSTLLKLVEESSDNTRWIFSVSNTDRVIKPLVSRSFVVDWVQNSPQTIQYQDDLKELIGNPCYLGIFKLHNRIADESEGNMEVAKKLHMECLSEMSLLLPSSKAKVLLKAKNEMKAQLRTEITFKSSLMEVLL